MTVDIDGWLVFRVHPEDHSPRRASPSDPLCAGNCVDAGKNGSSTPFLQIRDNMGANRLLKSKTKKKKKGNMRQCQTGMGCMLHAHTRAHAHMHVHTHARTHARMRT